MSEKETLRKVLLTYPRDELKKVIAASNITNIAKFSKPQLIEIMLKFSERFKDVKPFGKKSSAKKSSAKKVSKKSSPASPASPPKVSQILPPNFLENLKKAPKLSTKDKPLKKKETTEEIMEGWDGIDNSVNRNSYGAYGHAWWWIWAMYGIYIKDRAYGFIFTSFLTFIWLNGFYTYNSDVFIAFVQNFVSEGKYPRYPVNLERMNNARMILDVDLSLKQMNEEYVVANINTGFPTFTVDGTIFTKKEYKKVPDTRAYTFPTFDGDKNIPIIRKEIEASGLKLNGDDDLDMDLAEFEMDTYLGFDSTDFQKRLLAWNKVGDDEVGQYITGYTKQFGKEVMMDEDISYLSNEYMREITEDDIPASLQQREFTIPDWFSKWLDIPTTVTVNKTGLTELRAMLKFGDIDTNPKQLKQLGIAKKVKTRYSGGDEVEEFNENAGLSVVTQPTYSSGEKKIRLPAQRKKTI